MTKQSVLILCVVFAVLLIVAYMQGILVSSRADVSKEALPSAVDIHTQALNDGRTIMAMGHTMHPKILYVKPSQVLRFINHELDPISLMFDNKTMLTREATVGGEVEFVAPASLGTYQYMSATNASMTGTIVVEQ